MIKRKLFEFLTFYKYNNIDSVLFKLTYNTAYKIAYTVYVKPKIVKLNNFKYKNEFHKDLEFESDFISWLFSSDYDDYCNSLYIARKNSHNG